MKESPRKPLPLITSKGRLLELMLSHPRGNNIDAIRSNKEDRFSRTLTSRRHHLPGGFRTGQRRLSKVDDRGCFTKAPASWVYQDEAGEFTGSTSMGWEPEKMQTE